MPDVTAPVCLYMSVAYLNGASRVVHDIIAVPFVTVLADDPRYRLDDPRLASVSKTASPVAGTERRGRPRGPSAATLARWWTECGHDRVAFRARLEARLAKDGLLRPLAANTDEFEPIDQDDIDAPFA